MRILLAIALVVAITPGMSEVVEAALHLVIHADLPHHDAPQEDCEHTCTTLAHHCGCHGQTSAQTSSRAVAASSTESTTRLRPTQIETVRGRAGEPPPLRPPIA